MGDDTQRVQADTAYGRIEGRQRRGVLLFAGVPYAHAPVGPLRFAPPRPPAPWTGVRDATAFGPQAPQVGGTMEAIAGGGQTAPWSEDCLTLNVQTPACDGGRRPVLVWIHGGGFTTGASSVPWYDGTAFCRNGDVVVVTVNYRLGAFGWSHLAHLPDGHDEPEAGNAGLADQVAALQWVRQHIAGFGGDPGNVTVFGESAGAMSVGTLLGTPSAQGLFAKAVLQSGACHHVRTVEQAAEVTDRICAALGVHDVAGLRRVSDQQLLDAQVSASNALVRDRARRGDVGLGLPFGPVLGGATLPEHPLEVVRRGGAAHVPLLLGTTREEWNLFALMAREQLDDAALLARLERIVEDPAQMVAVYRQALDTDPDGAPAHDALWSAIMTDRVFTIPAIRLAEAQSAHRPADVFAYRFDWASSALDGRLGSCHALEIPFVFDGLHQPGVAFFTGDAPPAVLATAMHRAWIAFARTGSPQHDGLPAWPAYGRAGRATLHFDARSDGPDGTLACTVRHDPAPEQRAAWDGVL